MAIKTKLIEGTNAFEIYSKEDGVHIGVVSLEGKETLPHYTMGQKYKFEASDQIYLKELESIVKFMKRKQKQFDNTMN